MFKIDCFINDILEKNEPYLVSLSYNNFLSDDKKDIIRNLEVRGEAAKHISEQIRKKYPEIPWQQIVGLRNRLIHGYFVVDYDIVWNIITNELPDLKTKIIEILKEEELK